MVSYLGNFLHLESRGAVPELLAAYASSVRGRVIWVNLSSRNSDFLADVAVQRPPTGANQFVVIVRGIGQHNLPIAEQIIVLCRALLCNRRRVDLLLYIGRVAGSLTSGLRLVFLMRDVCSCENHSAPGPPRWDWAVNGFFLTPRLRTTILAAVTSASASPRFEKCLCIVFFSLLTASALSSTRELTIRVAFWSTLELVPV